MYGSRNQTRNTILAFLAGCLFISFFNVTPKAMLNKPSQTVQQR